MSLSDQVKTLLRKYAVKPRRKLGQNFCVDLDLLRKMVDYAEVGDEDVVLEVGAGFGFLTRLLSEGAKEVIAVEFDPKLVKALKNELSDRTNISIIEGDILKISLPSFNKIVANPPYAISSQLIYTLLEKPFERAILTLQREFAEKLTSQKGGKSYGSLTVIVGYRWDAELMGRVSREAFYPMPEVDSVVVQIGPHEPPFRVENEQFFFDFVKMLFTQRRKKLRNVLASFLRNKIHVRGREGRRLIEDLPFLDFRVNELAPEDLGILSNKIHRIVESKRISFKNRRFYVFPEVYMPSDDTFLLASHLALEGGEKVLDLGTGCGILGILAAEKAEKVVAIDVNPHAVECARLNARLNRVSERVEVRRGSLFDPLAADEKFDLILFNPPYLPEEGTPGSGWLERSWNGGPSGRRWIDKFLEDFPPYLCEGGRVLLVQSSLSNPEETIRKLEGKGFKAEIVAEEKLEFEKLMVIRASL